VQLAVYMQWQQDARLAGVERQVRDVLDWQVRWELFIRQLIDARTFADQVAIVRSANALDPLSRWTKLVKLRWPQLTPLVRQIRRIAHVGPR
jgi:hypothetical protein